MPSYKRLFIWVEGDDDERFFKSVITPKLRDKYDAVKIIKYAEMKKGRIYSYLRSINSMDADYICVADIDDSPCIMSKKEKIRRVCKNIDISKIIIVIKEIESWYLAGLDNKARNHLKIGNIANADNITKEKFNALIPDKFTSRIDFMLEILKYFSIEEAKRHNESFKYFMEKYDY